MDIRTKINSEMPPTLRRRPPPPGTNAIHGLYAQLHALHPQDMNSEAFNGLVDGAFDLYASSNPQLRARPDTSVGKLVALTSAALRSPPVARNMMRLLWEVVTKNATLATQLLLTLVRHYGTAGGPAAFMAACLVICPTFPLLEEPGPTFPLLEEPGMVEVASALLYSLFLHQMHRQLPLAVLRTLRTATVVMTRKFPSVAMRSFGMLLENRPESLTQPQAMVLVTHLACLYQQPYSESTCRVLLNEDLVAAIFGLGQNLRLIPHTGMLMERLVSLLVEENAGLDTTQWPEPAKQARRRVEQMIIFMFTQLAAQ